MASLTHWVDYLLWPNSPAMMHVQSVLWYALLAGAVALLYQRLMGLTVAAGVAALLYCVDDAAPGAGGLPGKSQRGTGGPLRHARPVGAQPVGAAMTGEWGRSWGPRC